MKLLKTADIQKPKNTIYFSEIDIQFFISRSNSMNKEVKYKKCMIILQYLYILIQSYNKKFKLNVIYALSKKQKLITAVNS